VPGATDGDGDGDKDGDGKVGWGDNFNISSAVSVRWDKNPDLAEVPRQASAVNGREA